MDKQCMLALPSSTGRCCCICRFQYDTVYDEACNLPKYVCVDPKARKAYATNLQHDFCENFEAHAD